MGFITVIFLFILDVPDCDINLYTDLEPYYFDDYNGDYCMDDPYANVNVNVVVDPVVPIMNPVYDAGVNVNYGKIYFFKV